MRMTIAAHVQTILNQIENAHPMSKEEQNRKSQELYGRCRALQRHAEVVPPLYREDQAGIVTIERYLESLKPTDILDDEVGLK
jgi:hypothetical protein